jgi:hypothetical protein
MEFPVYYIYMRDCISSTFLYKRFLSTNHVKKCLRGVPRTLDATTMEFQILKISKILLITLPWHICIVPAWSEQNTARYSSRNSERKIKKIKEERYVLERGAERDVTTRISIHESASNKFIFLKARSSGKKINRPLFFVTA